MIAGVGYHLEAADGPKPASIYLLEASVTGTETAIRRLPRRMAARRSATPPA